MWPRLAPEAGAAPDPRRAGRRSRRVRALLRLHRTTLVAVAVAAGIVLMVLHWR